MSFASTPADLSQAILAAPAWAQIGLTMPSERLREDAALTLARSILDTRL